MTTTVGESIVHFSTEENWTLKRWFQFLRFRYNILYGIRQVTCILYISIYIGMKYMTYLKRHSKTPTEA